MKTEVTQRVKDFFLTTKMSETAFGKKAGINQKTLNQQLKGESAISIDTITKILSAFPDVSGEWLISGEGEMLKNKSAPEKKKVLDDLPDLEKSGEVVKSLIDVINILAEQDKRLLNMKEKNAEMIQQLINMAEKIMDKDEALKKSQELAKAS